MIEAKLLRKKLKNGLIVDKWDLVTIIEKQEAEIEALKAKDLKKSMAIRSLNTQLKKALQYETYSR